MDEHGIAAALLPLVTAFCRVSISSVPVSGVALTASELLGGCRDWVRGRLSPRCFLGREILPSIFQPCTSLAELKHLGKSCSGLGMHSCIRQAGLRLQLSRLEKPFCIIKSNHRADLPSPITKQRPLVLCLHVP